MLKRNTKMDLTVGPILSSIVKYAFPIYLMGLLQNLMVAADSAVLGNMADSTAIASVGATTVIIHLLISSIITLSEGVKLVVGRAIGSKNFDRCKWVISTAMIAALGIGILVIPVGLFLSEDLLILMNCPPECIADASRYLTIYFLSAPILLVYNFGSAIIMVSGDSTKPMNYMLISGVVNVCLNVALCLTLDNKVVAVAIATLAGNLLSAALVIRDLLRLGDGYSLDLKHLSFVWSEFGLIFKLGIPFTISSLTYSFSNVQIQAELNSFGPSAIAGNVASGYVELVVGLCVVRAFSGTLNSFLSQNIGAGKHDRVSKALKIALVAVLISVAVTCSAGLIFGKPLLSIFVPEDALAIEYGVIRNQVLLPAYLVVAVATVAGAVVVTLGYGYIATINTIITVLSFRVLYMTFVYPLTSGGPVNLYLTYVISWTLEALFATVAALILYTRYKKGKYNKSF